MSGQTMEVVLRRQDPAPVDSVFPLCCPVEEYKWIPGWKCELVHCPNERVELGTVFTEIVSPAILTGSPFGKTTWTAILHEPANHRLHFQLQNKHSDSIYKIEMSDDGAGGTSTTLTFTYKALTDKGDRVIANGGEEKLKFFLEYISTMLDYYLREGKCISRLEVARFSASSDALGLTDKAKAVLGSVRQLLMRDEFRKRYLKELAEGKR